MLDTRLVIENYKGTLYALACGVSIDRCKEIELEAAEENDFDAAEGIRLGLLEWSLSEKVFNCNVKPIGLEFDDNIDYYDDTTDY